MYPLNLSRLYTQDQDFHLASCLYPQVKSCTQEAIDTIRSLRLLLVEEGLTDKSFDGIEFSNTLEELGVAPAAVDELMPNLFHYLDEEGNVSFSILEKVEKVIFANDMMEHMVEAKLNT